ncbi:hypothetical protein WDX09_004549 [Salmonella enterica]
MSRNESTQITIGNDWTQVTDGSADEVIQFYTVVDICRSPLMRLLRFVLILDY